MLKFQAHKTYPTFKNHLKYHQEKGQQKTKKCPNIKEDLGFIAETLKINRKKQLLKKYRKNNKIKMNKFNLDNHFHTWRT